MDRKKDKPMNEDEVDTSTDEDEDEEHSNDQEEDDEEDNQMDEDDDEENSTDEEEDNPVTEKKDNPVDPKKDNPLDEKGDPMDQQEDKPPGPMEQKVTLESQDDVLYEVELNAVKHSKLIKGLLINLGQWPNEEGTHKPILPGDESIPITQVKGVTLEKVVEYLNHYKDQPELEEDEESMILRKLDDIDKWDEKLLAPMRRGEVYEIMLAGNFMGIRGIVECCAKTIAGWLKGKTVEQIRQEFGIVNDFSPEEEDRIRRETEWCEPDRDLI